MFNKDYKIYKIFGIVVSLVLVLFISLNVASYLKIQGFAKAHQVDEIKYGRFANDEYETNYISHTMAGNPQYSQSIVKFYRNGEDVVITDQAYVSFNDMNDDIISWYLSYAVSTTIVLVFSLLGLLSNLRLQHFSHGHLFGLIAAILSIFLEISVFMNPIVTTLIIISLVSSVYFYSKSRFYDFNENKWLGIFKYKAKMTDGVFQ